MPWRLAKYFQNYLFSFACTMHIYWVGITLVSTRTRGNKKFKIYVSDPVIMKKNKTSRKSKVEEICCRKQSQLLMAILLPVVVIGGYFCPRLGFIVVGLITVFMIIASKRGRFYCGWLCPMGAFHERFLSLVSFQNPIPPFFKSSWFRWLLFTVMMSFMFTRLYMAWGDPKAVGSVFRTMWIVSTTIAIGLGLYFKPRTWCTVCPMGSFQGVSSKKHLSADSGRQLYSM